MMLYDSIVNRLGEVNCVQLNEANRVSAYLWYGPDWAWRQVTGDPETGIALSTADLAKFIQSLPHVAVRKGSVLVVTVVDPTKAIPE